jgi:hypothetical protein
MNNTDMKQMLDPNELNIIMQKKRFT